MIGAAGVFCSAGATGAGSGGLTICGMATCGVATCGVATFGAIITRGNRSSNFVACCSFAGGDLIALIPRVTPSTVAGSVRNVVGIRSDVISDKLIISYYAARSNC
jgi:hypothetical protein